MLQVEIDGAGLGSTPNVNGLTIDAGHCVVQGLAIAGFTGQGDWAIQVGGASGDVGNIIAGDFIGTDTGGEGFEGAPNGNVAGISAGAYTLIGSSAQLSLGNAAGDTVGIDDTTIAGGIDGGIAAALAPYASGTALYAAESAT